MFENAMILKKICDPAVAATLGFRIDGQHYGNTVLEFKPRLANFYPDSTQANVPI